MQIQASSTAEVHAIIAEYISQGWHQLSLATHSGHMNDILRDIEQQRAFQRILQSNEIAINAQHITDAREFVLTLVFNPENPEALGLLEGLLRWLKSLNYVYGKQIFFEQAGLNNRISPRLQALIDSFWKNAEPEQESQEPYSKAKRIDSAQAPESTPDTSTAKSGKIKKALAICAGVVLLLGIAARITYTHILDNPDIVARISHQDFLEHIYTQSENIDVQNAAIRNLKDEQLLFDIIMHDKNSQLHEAAIAGIHSLELLKEVFVNYPRDCFLIEGLFERFLAMAAQKGAGTDFFTEVAQKTSISELRTSTLAYITDPAILASFTQQDYQEDVRRRAIELISDEDVLYAIVRNKEETPPLRHMAARKIERDDFLIDILAHHIRLEMYSPVINDLLDKIEDQDYLYRAALGNAEYRDHRFPQWAAARIQDQQKLKDVVLNSQDFQVRETAVKRIDDPDFLKQVIANDRHNITVSAALEHLQELLSQ